MHDGGYLLTYIPPPPLCPTQIRRTCMQIGGSLQLLNWRTKSDFLTRLPRQQHRSRWRVFEMGCSNLSYSISTTSTSFNSSRTLRSASSFHPSSPCYRVINIHPLSLCYLSLIVTHCRLGFQDMRTKDRPSVRPLVLHPPASSQQTTITNQSFCRRRFVNRSVVSVSSIR